MSAIKRIFRGTFLKSRPAFVVLSKRGVGYEISSTFSKVDVPRIPIDQLVFKYANKWGQKTAVECGLTGRKYSYDELRWGIENFNKALRKKLKLKPGDVVAIMMPNVPEYPIASFGILQGGMVVTPINPIYTEEEIARQLSDSKAKVLVTLGSFIKVAISAIAKTDYDIPIIGVTTKEGENLPSGVINFKELITSRYDIKDVDINHDDVVLLPYSSGTTGLPKGVELTNQNLIANVMQCTSSEVAMMNYTEGDHQEVTPAILPMFHIYGTESLFWFLHFGAKVVTLPRFTPELYADTLVKHRPGALFLVPPIVIYLTNYPGVTSDHLKSVNFINSGAAPLGALDEEKLMQKAKKDVQVLQGYGLSESPVVTVTSAKRLKTPGSVGEPLPNTIVKVVAIDDPSETALGPNQTGELYVKGPQIMKGYFNNPEATRNTFSNGWFKTGDMVFYDENRKFFVTDRIKELIKVKGFQVAPAELEEIIRNFKGVADACVIGVPHELTGEVPRAYIVQKKGEDVNVEKLKEYVESKVAAYKKLEGGVAIVDAIPKNASGKLLRRQLKTQYLHHNQ